MYVNAKNVIYFDSFGVEHISKKWETSLEIKILQQIFIEYSHDSIMRGYFCIGFIDFLLKGKRLLEYANLFSPNEYNKNEKVILKVIFRAVSGDVWNLSQARNHSIFSLSFVVIIYFPWG